MRPKSTSLIALFRAERTDPIPFYQRLAADAVASIPMSIEGHTVIDLGCGPGHYTRALRNSGAFVVPIDLSPDEFRLPGGPPGGEILGSGMALPFATATVNGVLSSNMIEHTPDPEQVIREIERVLRPGGWLWLSWTNWYSPWGGHDMSPFHYLGPRFGMRVRNALRLPEPKNYPMRSLFPLHIGSMLRLLRGSPGLNVILVSPRYYPRHKWIVKIPVLREVLTWNCLVIVERSTNQPSQSSG